MIASLVRERNALGRPTVLGLPTGSTPVGTYRELVRLHKAEDLDFSNVITFNLDEYYGMAADQLQSYHRWMQEHLFTHEKCWRAKYAAVHGFLCVRNQLILNGLLADPVH